MATAQVQAQPLAGPLSMAAISATTVLVCVAILIPVIMIPIPPLVDYPNHLARMHIIATLAHDPILSQFYQLDWALIPNLMMDLVVPPLAALIGVYPAGRLFIAITLVLLITGPMALHRAAFGTWSLAPLIGSVIAYNGILNLGLLNYIFGIGLSQRPLRSHSIFAICLRWVSSG
jgi:hypothetical protein